MKKTNLNTLYLACLASSGMVLSSCNNGSTGATSGNDASGQTIQATQPEVTALFAGTSATNNTSPISVSVSTDDTWDTGWCGSILVKNISTSTVKLSSMQFTIPSGSRIDDSWNGQFSNSNGVVTVKLPSGTQVKSGRTYKDTGLCLEKGKGITNAVVYYPGGSSGTGTVPTTPPITQKGSLTLKIDTTNAGCTATSCSNISITVKDINGSTVATVAVPQTGINTIYSQKIESMNAANYILQASAVASASLTYTPNATPAITANNNTQATIIYKKLDPVITTGNATISLPQVVPAYTGSLLLKLINTKDSNKIVNTYSVKQGQSITTEALPMSDSTHAYVLQAQGIADPLSGSFYLENGTSALTITANKTTTLAVPYKLSTITKHKVTFNISGLVGTDSAAINFQDGAQKYAYVSYSGLSNAPVSYNIENNTDLGYIIKTSGTSYSINPIEDTETITASTIFNVAFLSNIIVPPAPNSGINHPFPQSSRLSYKLADGTTAIYPTSRRDSDASTFYDYWKISYITSAGTSNGNALYRVKLAKSGTDANTTVSEGQGYGMLITVLMAGYDKNAQATFDGLFRYVKANPSENDKRLMDWEQPQDSSGNDSAFDGDADIAMALVLADQQWGSSGAINYAAEAKTMIAGISASTIGKDSYLPMLGDWVEQNGTKYNQWTPRSSDFMLDNFRAYAFITGDSSYWNKVISNSQAVISNIQSQYSATTGLLPDFTSGTSLSNIKPVSGTFLEDKNDGNYDYNAGRDPWRIGVDALLNKDFNSLAQTRKMSTWMQSASAGNPQKINAGYLLNGSKISSGNYFTTFFAAPFGVAAMTGGTAQQQWLNSIYDAVKTTHEDYYEDSITMMCLLVMTGNYWNPDIVQ